MALCGGATRQVATQGGQLAQIGDGKYPEGRSTLSLALTRQASLIDGGTSAPDGLQRSKIRAALPACCPRTRLLTAPSHL